jgi:hypothetical protein
MERRTTRLGSKNAPFGRSIAATSSSLGPVLPGAGASKLAIQAGFRPPFACPVQPLKAAPRIGHGRLPKAPRVRACEARPRAPHPTGSGYPSPAKLSLCPTSVTPLEAPLIGQDAINIREVLRAGITVLQDSKNLMLMNEGFLSPPKALVHDTSFFWRKDQHCRHPEVLAVFGEPRRMAPSARGHPSRRRAKARLLRMTV